MCNCENSTGHSNQSFNTDVEKPKGYGVKKDSHDSSSYISAIIVLITCFMNIFILSVALDAKDDIEVIQSRLVKIDTRLFMLESKVVNLEAASDELRDLKHDICVLTDKPKKLEDGMVVFNSIGLERTLFITKGKSFGTIYYLRDRDGIIEKDKGCPDCLGLVNTEKEVLDYMKIHRYTFKQCY